MPPRTASRPTDALDGAERGATGVEVALLIAIVAMVVVGAVQVLGRGSNTTIAAAGSGIENSSDDEDGDGGTPPGGGDGGDGGGAGGGGTPPQTTPPATTTSPPPTTAAPAPTTSAPTTAPSTTTTAPPATTVPAGPASTSLAPLDAVRDGGNWRASTEVELTTSDATGLPGATVTLEVRTYRPAGPSSGWHTTEITVTTGADGTVPVELGPFSRNGGNRITEIELTVVGVDTGDGSEWDGDGATVTTTQP